MRYNALFRYSIYLLLDTCDAIVTARPNNNAGPPYSSVLIVRLCPLSRLSIPWPPLTSPCFLAQSFHPNCGLSFFLDHWRIVSRPGPGRQGREADAPEEAGEGRRLLQLRYSDKQRHKCQPAVGQSTDLPPEHQVRPAKR